MRLKSFRLRNYKGHRDTDDLKIGSRFTVFIGQNNSGKSSLLEALSAGSFTDRPHLLPRKAGALPQIPNPSSEMVLNLETSGSEFEWEILMTAPEAHIPLPSALKDNAQEFVSDLFAKERLTFELIRRSNGWFSNFPSHRQFNGDLASTNTAVVTALPDRQNWAVSRLMMGADNLHLIVAQMFQKSIYGFKAERMNIGQCAISETKVLAPDASNLPSALLQMAPDEQRHYINLIREIFPTIYQVTSRPDKRENTAQIEAQIEVTTTYDADGRLREGITVPLTECGTGVSQVLALLYVVVTAKPPLGTRIIVIDEPNSFLHPGAAKKLISILKRSSLQFIISTHSADLIRAMDPDVLHLIGWKETASSFQTVDRTSILHQRKILSNLGVSLSDVFGADNILWVEGPTEERCFPLLLEHLQLLSPAIVVASLVAVDDLTSKSRKAELSWDIYKRLSNGTALIPSALAFSFDRDGRSEQNIRDMERTSKNLANFLPRRMYENFLLHPKAIADLLSSSLAIPVSEDQILERLNSYDPDWQKTDADAAKLLSKLFPDLSDAKLEFRKTEHSVALTKFILKNDPDHLSELLKYCKRLVEGEKELKPTDRPLLT
jgi:predicted ATPase